MGTLVNERTAARRPVVLIWIDTEAATLVRWTGTAHVERIASDAVVMPALASVSLVSTVTGEGVSVWCDSISGTWCALAIA